MKINSDFYKKVLDNSHDEIFVTDSTGRTLYCNSTFEKNYGVKRSDIIGEKFWLSADVKSMGGYPIPMVLESKQKVSVQQETNTGRKLIITATPVFDDNKDIELIVENCRDITELENIKQTLAQTKMLMNRYKQEVSELRNLNNHTGDSLIFNSEKMRPIVELIHRVADVDTNILLLGESGTGKSSIAKYIHNMSPRSDNAFITINCAAIPPSLLESELFGYVPGAFTGANTSGKIGLVELAHKGTLFLDEIGELPLGVQVKLLEFIQEQVFTPVGGLETKKVDVRIISATNCDLINQIDEKSFRKDLYYRLKVVELNIPPLRERPEDIFSLIHYFINEFDNKYRFSHSISDKCIEVLSNYNWPGNIRELRHLIEQLIVTVPDSTIDIHHLPEGFNTDITTTHNIFFNELIPLDLAIAEVESKLLIKAYEKYRSSYKVAKALGMSQSTASRKLRKCLKDIDINT